MLDYLNVRTEPDYDYTATIDKKYLFNKNICKLLENSCHNNDNDTNNICTDENLKLLKACFIEDFDTVACDYGIKKFTNPGIKHFFKLYRFL